MREVPLEEIDGVRKEKERFIRVPLEEIDGVRKEKERLAHPSE